MRFEKTTYLILNIGDEIMANIKSQKKRIITNERNRVHNVDFRSKMRTSIKKVKVACSNNDLAKAKELLPLAISLIDKSVKDGIQHQNTAARQKSNLMTMVNKLESKSQATA